LAFCEKAKQRGVKVYRWMNFGERSIFAQAKDLVSLLEKYKLGNEVFIKDTYCEFIECIVADEYVVIVLPNERARGNRDVEVGVGFMIRQREIANYFFDWFEKRLPVKQTAFQQTGKLNKYAKKRREPRWRYARGAK
jgi:hypothetical protein